MSLKAQDRLGPYEILAPIGAGGMGEVYRAHDTRLNRDVALKVLPESFAHDPERMARFEREARAVAALNHPHICQLYDVGPNYLVMELIEGAPLKGPLPLNKAVEYAGQILDALDAAHRKGITHRDLKPGNIHAQPTLAHDPSLIPLAGTPLPARTGTGGLTMLTTLLAAVLLAQEQTTHESVLSAHARISHPSSGV